MAQLRFNKPVLAFLIFFVILTYILFVRHSADDPIEREMREATPAKHIESRIISIEQGNKSITPASSESPEEKKKPTAASTSTSTKIPTTTTTLFVTNANPKIISNAKILSPIVDLTFNYTMVNIIVGDLLLNSNSTAKPIYSDSIVSLMQTGHLRDTSNLTSLNATSCHYNESLGMHKCCILLEQNVGNASLNSLLVVQSLTSQDTMFYCFEWHFNDTVTFFSSQFVGTGPIPAQTNQSEFLSAEEDAIKVEAFDNQTLDLNKTTLACVNDTKNMLALCSIFDIQNDKIRSVGVQQAYCVNLAIQARNQVFSLFNFGCFPADQQDRQQLITTSIVTSTTVNTTVVSHPPQDSSSTSNKSDW